MACRQLSLSAKLRRIRIPNHSSTPLTLIVLLCTSFIIHVDAHRIPESNQPPLGRVLPRDDQGFAGNPDLYGVGIRAGYYSQLIATFFATALIPENTREIRNVNLLFQFTLFVGMVFQGTQEDFYAIECYLLILLLAGVTILQFSYPLICRAIEGSWKGLSNSFDCSMITLVLSVFMLMAFYSYSTWFWWIGMDTMLPNPSLTYAPDLSKTSVYNSPRTVGKTLNAFALFYTCLFSFIYVIRLATREQPISFRDKGRNLFLCFIDSLFDEPKYFGKPKEDRVLQGESSTSGARPGSPGLDSVFWYMVGTIVGFLGVINTIVGVESILRFNQVTRINQIYSAGQLIPFAAGVGTLVQVFKNIYVIKRGTWRALTHGCGQEKYSPAMFFDFLARKSQDLGSSSIPDDHGSASNMHLRDWGRAK